MSNLGVDASDQASDHDLIRAITEGNQEAFRVFYRRHVRPIFWLASSLIADGGTAEEVTQDVFVTAWKKLPGFRLESASALPWLSQICRFKAMNARRKRDASPTQVELVEHDLPASESLEDRVMLTQLTQHIMDRLGSLGEIDQRIYFGCVVDGKSYQEVASELGVVHGTVRNRLARVRSALRPIPNESSAAERTENTND